MALSEIKFPEEIEWSVTVVLVMTSRAKNDTGEWQELEDFERITETWSSGRRNFHSFIKELVVRETKRLGRPTAIDRVMMK